MVLTLQCFRNFPGDVGLTKEPVCTFEVDYVTWSNKSLHSTIISNAMRVFYNCSELRELKRESLCIILCKAHECYILI